MTKIIKRALLLCLTFVLAFLSLMPLSVHAEESEYPYNYYIPVNYGNHYFVHYVGSTVPVVFRREHLNSLRYFLYEDGVYDYIIYTYSFDGELTETDSRWDNRKASYGTAYHMGNAMDCDRIEQATSNVVLFGEDVTNDEVLNYIQGDTTELTVLIGTPGLELTEPGVDSGGGSGGPVTDDMLEGIWGGIVDQEVVLEEDDGTVLGAIRTWIKNLSNMISSPLQTVKELIKKIPLSTITVLEGSNFFDKILQLVNDVNSMKYDLFENFKETGPGEMLFDIVDAVNTFKLQLFENFAESELGKTLFGIVDSVNGMKLDLFENFAESELGKKLFEINDYINGLPGEIVKFFQESEFGDLLDLVNYVNDLKTEIPKGIMEYLGEKLELLFVPDKANLEARVTSIREEFAFVDSLFEAGKHILNTLEASTGRSAPVITVDLSKYSGSHYWGDQKVVIDFSWYAPYKESVDIVIASIIWVTWLWSVWKRLPDIIAGAGMVTDVQNMSADMERGYRIKPKSDFIIIPRGKKK